MVVGSMVLCIFVVFSLAGKGNGGTKAKFWRVLMTPGTVGQRGFCQASAPGDDFQMLTTRQYHRPQNYYRSGISDFGKSISK